MLIHIAVKILWEGRCKEKICFR